MKLSAETYVMRERYDDKTALDMLAEASFDCYDYSMYWMSPAKDMLGDSYREKAKELRAYADSIGIMCNQAHAPFDFKHGEPFSVSNENYKRLARSIETAAVLGANNIIIHAIKRFTEPVDFTEYNYGFYRSFLPLCEEYGIRISVENLFNSRPEGGFDPVLSDPNEHMAFVEGLASPWFDICVDVGHSAITGFAPDKVIGAMNNRLLKALHIHDNDYRADRHMLPFTSDLPWDKITAALAAIDYTGELTLEITTIQKFDNTMLKPALALGAAAGRKLIAQIEQNKQ